MIDFEQELYNRFGQVKDFTLGMRIAKYFYELGETRMKEQMLKDAVEGIVTTRSMAGNIVTAHLDWSYKDGQKVKLIIIKEDAE